MLLCEDIDILTELMVEISGAHPFDKCTDQFGPPCEDPVLVPQRERLWGGSMGPIRFCYKPTKKSTAARASEPIV